jgi:hypothetical protein
MRSVFLNNGCNRAVRKSLEVILRMGLLIKHPKCTMWCNLLPVMHYAFSLFCDYVRIVSRQKILEPSL